MLIAVSDDGAGIDAEAVRAAPIERGLTTADAPLSDAEIYSFLFQPGFSTAKQVTDLSGRGVGMDVVRQRVESLRGSIDVASQRGAGTTVTLRLPLTLAIIDGLLVTVGEAYFVLPLASTLECIELTREESERRTASTWRMCAGRSFRISGCGSTSTWRRRRRSANRSWWWRARTGAAVWWWIRCWGIARR